MKFKKPKFWDYDKPNLVSFLLLPFTILIILNNFFLSFKKRTKREKIKTICVGNIYLGGTGKTPTTLKLYEILNKLNLNVVIAKKFYSSQEDERLILKKKSNFITGKSRTKILDKISNNNEIVIFDDGLQDSVLDYDLKIVCFDSNSWIGNGCLLPSGPLREKLNSLQKYDAVFLKNIGEPRIEIINHIKKNYQHLKIFNTNYKIKNYKNINFKEKYLIFSGIGNPNNFRNFLIKNKLNIVSEVVFPDHYEYKVNDIISLKKEAKKFDAKVITTEKDFVKIPIDYRIGIEFLEVDLEILEEKILIDFLKSKKIYE